jgi:tetratricopeptide (TPR) repeat protein
MRALLILGLSVSITAAAHAAPGGAPRPERPAPTSTTLPTRDPQAQGPRQEAEEIYALAHEEVAKAKKDLEAGKAKNAEKKFKRALERTERAVALDPRYHEAWNILGYCARKLGDYPRALAAYEKCLAIEPNYVPAREYLGEAYVDRGEPARARAQLAVLERLGAAEEAAELREMIEAYEKAHPAAAPPDSAAAAPKPAAADSASALPDTTAGSSGR